MVIVQTQTNDGDKLDALLQAVRRIEDEVGEIRTRLDRMEGKQSYRAQSGDNQRQVVTLSTGTWTEPEGTETPYRVIYPSRSYAGALSVSTSTNTHHDPRKDQVSWT